MRGDRDVRLKILSASFSGHPDRLALPMQGKNARALNQLHNAQTYGFEQPRFVGQEPCRK